MPTKPTIVKQFKSWSYSRWGDWVKCPLMSKLKHLDKIKEPGSPAMDRGTRIHKEAEGWSTRKKEVHVEVFKNGRKTVETIKLKKMPKSLECFKKEFDGLREISRLLATEQQIAFSDKWEQTEWFDSDAQMKGRPLPWVRITMDCRYPLQSAKGGRRAVKIIDYKTGKIREENKRQLELYAVAAFELDDELEEASTEFWYLDEGELVEMSFVRADAERLKKEWQKKTLPMLSDVRFKPKPSSHCGWCHYRKANAAAGGGQCKF